MFSDFTLLQLFYLGIDLTIMQIGVTIIVGVVWGILKGLMK